MYRKFSLRDQLVKIGAGGIFLFVAHQGYEQAPEVALILVAAGGLLVISALWKYEKV